MKTTPCNTRWRVVRSATATALQVGTLVFLCPSLVLAYVDPVSGSIVLQILAAGLFAASLVFRRIRTRISGAFRTLLGRFRA